jgi:hypothetical protein
LLVKVAMFSDMEKGEISAGVCNGRFLRLELRGCFPPI